MFGAMAALAGCSTLVPRPRPQAWRVSFVSCDEPITTDYDGERVSATLLTSRTAAEGLLREVECFEREPYLTLDYDAYFVSVRTIALPAGTSLQTRGHTFDGDTLRWRFDVVDDEGATGRIRHVVTTWDLNGASPPSQIEIRLE